MSANGNLARLKETLRVKRRADFERQVIEHENGLIVRQLEQADLERLEAARRRRRVYPE